MKAWQTVAVNGREWKIGFKRNLHVGDILLDGMTRPIERTITLNEDLKGDPEEFLDTLIHEMLHACEFNEGLRCSRESRIRTMGRSLAQMLKPFLKIPKF
jgi:hypothetical protein